MTDKRFVTDGLWIQDTKPKGRKYLLDEQGGVNALCNLINGMSIKSERLEMENEQLKQQIKDLRLNVLDSIHKADEIQCTCNPCVVEECVKKVVE